MKTIHRKHLPFLTAAIVWLLCGCSNETGPQSGLAAVPLGVGSLRLEAGPVTRAGGTPVTMNGAVAGVFLTGGGYAPVYNRAYYYLLGQWKCDDSIYVDGRTGKVLGVYDPNNVVTFAPGGTVTSSALQAQAYSEKALWYYDNTSGAGVNNTRSQMNFSMKCAYARLSFVLSRDVKYAYACKVSRFVIKPSSGSFRTSARVDIADGSLTGTAVDEHVIDTSLLPMNTFGIAAGHPDSSIDRLLPAQKLAAGAGLTFVLTVDGNAYSVTVPAATFNDIQAGMQYTVQLEMAGQGLGIREVTLTDWAASAGPGIDSHLD